MEQVTAQANKIFAETSIVTKELSSIGIKPQGSKRTIFRSEDTEYQYVRHDFSSLGFGGDNTVNLRISNSCMTSSFRINFDFAIRKSTADATGINVTSPTGTDDGTNLLRQFVSDATYDSYLDDAQVVSKNDKLFVLDPLGFINKIAMHINNIPDPVLNLLQYKKTLLLKCMTGNKMAMMDMPSEKLHSNLVANPLMTERSRAMLFKYPMTEKLKLLDNAEIYRCSIPLNTFFNMPGVVVLPTDSVRIVVTFNQPEELYKHVLYTNPLATYAATDLPSTLAFTMLKLQVSHTEYTSNSRFNLEYRHLAETLFTQKPFVYRFPHIVEQYPESTTLQTILHQSSLLLEPPRYICLFKWCNPEERTVTPNRANDIKMLRMGTCENLALIEDGVRLRVRVQGFTRPQQFDDVQFTKGGNEEAHHCYDNFKDMAQMPHLTYSQWVECFPCVCIKTDFVINKDAWVSSARQSNYNMTATGSIPAVTAVAGDMSYYLMTVTQKIFLTAPPAQPWTSDSPESRPVDMATGGDGAILQSIHNLLARSYARLG